ncbi:hypothetical protein Bca101_037987 [Brassica carinata]
MRIERVLEDFKEELASALVSGSFEKLKDELASLFFDSFQSVQHELASSRNELDKWKSAFQKESFVPSRKSPGYIILEIAQLKLAICDLKAQLKPESEKRETFLLVKPFFPGLWLQPEVVTALTQPTDGGTEVHDEQQQQLGSTPSGPSLAYLEEKLRAATARIAELNEYQKVELKAMAKEMEYNRNVCKVILEKFPDLVPPPPAPEADNELK